MVAGPMRPASWYCASGFGPNFVHVWRSFSGSFASSTSALYHVKKLAATAFKTLLARIRYPSNDPKEILLDAPLVARQST